MRAQYSAPPPQSVFERQPEGAVVFTVDVHAPLLQAATTVPPPEFDVPSSAVVGPAAQRHPGYCRSHAASSASKRIFSEARIPIAVCVPQQSVWWSTATQSVSLAQDLSKVGKLGVAAPEQTTWSAGAV
jgi:hypothetical protein